MRRSLAAEPLTLLNSSVFSSSNWPLVRTSSDPSRLQARESFMSWTRKSVRSLVRFRSSSSAATALRSYLSA